MDASQSALAVPAERGELRGGRPQADLHTIRSMSSPVRRAIIRTRQWLLEQQHPDGSWCAELEGDTILESETILLWAFLGCQHTEQAQRTAEYLVEKQLPEGGWEMYPGGGLEISGSVKAYFALKITGHDPGSDYMQRAREAIMAAGGADAVNSYTRFYLALLGQISYDQCPAVPPEVMLLPKWFPANIYAISSWSRTIVVPLSIISAMQPVRKIDPQLGIRELFLADPQDWPPLRCPGLPGGTGMFSWDRFFHNLDGMLKWCQRHRLLPLRKKAISKAEEWMLEHFENSDGLGAIYPPIVWSIIALRCLGYADDSPEVEYCHQQLADLIIDEEDSDSIRIQPCKSPVWDTAITCRSLESAGMDADSPAMRTAMDWLLDKQVKRPGDWARTVKAEPGGWCFEYANDFYPDCDDTALVFWALQSRFQRQS
jgi:squalene-hopene/tetraprenyl-beta-curcumene cyclase